MNAKPSWLVRQVQRPQLQSLTSIFMGFLANIRWRWYKNRKIKQFISKYDIDLNELLLPSLSDYPNFNAFFIRKLKPESRPFPKDNRAIISPVDGLITGFCYNKEDKIIAKSHIFTISDLLANEPSLLASFNEAESAIFYLSPKDYHRVHMPFDGYLSDMYYIPGYSYSVNHLLTTVERVFPVNDRVVMHFITDHGDFLLVMVGALVVRSIVTSWSGLVKMPSGPRKKIYHWNYKEDNKFFKRGEELGYFALGSTVIMLWQKNSMLWDRSDMVGSEVKMGQSIACWQSDNL